MLTVYSKPRCMDCMYTKMYLDQNKIEYEDDEFSDPNKVLMGFKVDRLERLIE